MIAKIVTAERGEFPDLQDLKERLCYDPKTGSINWTSDKRNARNYRGRQAGAKVNGSLTIDGVIFRLVFLIYYMATGKKSRMLLLKDTSLSRPERFKFSNILVCKNKEEYNMLLVGEKDGKNLFSYTNRHGDKAYMGRIYKGTSPIFSKQFKDQSIAKKEIMNMKNIKEERKTESHSLPSQSYLMKTYDYNPETGKFISRLSGKELVQINSDKAENIPRRIHLRKRAYKLYEIIYVYTYGKSCGEDEEFYPRDDNNSNTKLANIGIRRKKLFSRANYKAKVRRGYLVVLDPLINVTIGMAGIEEWNKFVKHLGTAKTRDELIKMIYIYRLPALSDDYKNGLNRINKYLSINKANQTLVVDPKITDEFKCYPYRTRVFRCKKTGLSYDKTVLLWWLVTGDIVGYLGFFNSVKPLTLYNLQYMGESVSFYKDVTSN